ncbi:MAG: type II toxin-antitoxin system RelE/ParE family toxin [Parasporobacterium sp.]|nr:type II toxin-antitoxin system RelE/ParE family toxin [Parasporobacterium sp.]
MRQVEISRIVRKKLLSLKEDLTERFDENVAGKAITSLVSAMDSLGLFPEKGVSISSIYSLETDYCYLFSTHNYIVYRFDETTVTILQLFDERQDFMKTLFGLSGRTQESIDYWDE